MLYIFSIACLVGLQLILPKKFAFLPLVIAGLHLGNSEILPQLTPARIIIIAGLARAIGLGYSSTITIQKLDILALLLGLIILASTVGHSADQWTPSPLNARIGLALNLLGTYFYGRLYLQKVSDFKRYILLLPLLLLPLGLLLTLEQKTLRNPYSSVGAISNSVSVREDKVRARGPFRHAILAGTCGATFLPLVWIIARNRRRLYASVGFLACILIVLSSASSGPLAATIFAVGCGLAWRLRGKVSVAIWCGIGVALFYSLASGRAPWYLMAKIDLVGGSTGWHRAYLIDQGVKHLGEWWLWGTDYTRHWMPTGVSWNPNMSDITNYYLHLGVISGAGAVILLFVIIGHSINSLYKAMGTVRHIDTQYEFILGMTIVSILTHAISFISISYFDQMYVFFYLLIGAVPALTKGARNILLSESDTN